MARDVDQDRTTTKGCGPRERGAPVATPCRPRARPGDAARSRSSSPCKTASATRRPGASRTAQAGLLERGGPTDRDVRQRRERARRSSASALEPEQELAHHEIAGPQPGRRGPPATPSSDDRARRERSRASAGPARSSPGPGPSRSAGPRPTAPRRREASASVRSGCQEQRRRRSRARQRRVGSRPAPRRATAEPVARAPAAERRSPGRRAGRGGS